MTQQRVLVVGGGLAGLAAVMKLAEQGIAVGAHAGMALQSAAMVAVYLIGVLSCVYHLANGLWTMGITWGVWTSPRAQARASAVCGVFGLLLAVVSMGGLFGMRAVGNPDRIDEAVQAEDRMYKFKTQSGEVAPQRTQTEWT